MTNTNQLKTAVLATVVGVMAPLAMIVPASAATQVFGARSAVDIGRMAASTSWVSSTVPVNGDTVSFPASATYQIINNDISSLSLVKILFDGESTVPSSSKSFTVTGNGLTITSGIDAVMTGLGGDHIVDTDVTLGANATFMTSGSNTLTVGGTGKITDLNSHTLTIDAAGRTITLQGLIGGTGSINITNGKLNMLAAPAVGFNATVTVSGGEFVVSDQTEGNVVIAGGALKGDSGEEGLLGTVTMNSGSIMPGESPGCISVSNLIVTGGTYGVELQGTDRCSGYDSVQVTDNINLGEGVAELAIDRLPTFEPAVGDEFAIMTYADDSEVEGFFTGLENGDTVDVGGYTYEINYSNENAVTLTVLGVADVVTPDVPETGIGSLITSPLVTLSAAGATLMSLGAVRYAEAFRRK